MALFITFEGGEGSGKTTQARSLHRRLVATGIPAIFVREPGTTLIGNKIRHLLKNPRTRLTPMTELLLIAAARSQIVEEVISPNLAKGITVVADRYADSSVAYQGYARGLGPQAVEDINRFATHGLMPDLTFLLDVPADIGLSRKKTAGTDRFELEERAFHERVRQGYLKLAEDGGRWHVIDAMLPRTEIGVIIWSVVREYLGRTSERPGMPQ